MISVRSEFMVPLQNAQYFSCKLHTGSLTPHVEKKGRAVNVLAKKSTRKRTKEEVDLYREEERLFKSDKIAFFQEFRRRKIDVEDQFEEAKSSAESMKQPQKWLEAVGETIDYKPVEAFHI